jgi:hypothetical protein
MPTKNAPHPAMLARLDPENIPLVSKILALFGATSELHPLVLQSLFVRTRRGERVGVIVGDNHLNAYTLARLARAHGFNPTTLLAQIEFSRPFTCHQLHHCIANLVAEKSREWSALYVLGLLDPFYDEDIRLPIVAQLLNDALARLRHIALQELSVLVTISPPPSETTRGELIARVLRAADAYWQPSPIAINHFAATQSKLW